MTQVDWTPQAIEDIEAIRGFISRDSLKYASLVAERLVEAVDRLESFPLSGRIVPEIGEELVREVIYEAYRIVYRVKPGSVEVLTVFHASRLLKVF